MQTMHEPAIWWEAPQALKSPRDLIRFAMSRFQRACLTHGHGFPDALSEARYLVAHSLGLPVEDALVWLDATLTATEIQESLWIIRKRIETRSPAAYLTGEAWVAGFRFRSDPRAIVPRSLIGELLEDEALSTWLKLEEIGRAADVCTGGGSLAILLALAAPLAMIDAVDLSPEALALAQENVEDYGLEDRITLHEGHLTEPLMGPYELLIANPPYVDDAAMASLPEEYRHEPSLALTSGVDGLLHTREILAKAPALLSEEGLLVVEVGHQRGAVELAFPDLPLTWLDSRDGGTYVFAIPRSSLLNA